VRRAAERTGLDQLQHPLLPDRARVFIGILAVGLVYVWAKGDLEWIKRVPAERRTDEPGVRRAA
jgi:hypothetical protein